MLAELVQRGRGKRLPLGVGYEARYECDKFIEMLKVGDFVQIFREENYGWTLLGTAEVESTNGTEVKYKTMPFEVRAGDMAVVVGASFRLPPVPVFRASGESLIGLERRK